MRQSIILETNQGRVDRHSCVYTARPIKPPIPERGITILQAAEALGGVAVLSGVYRDCVNNFTAGDCGELFDDLIDLGM